MEMLKILHGTIDANKEPIFKDLGNQLSHLCRNIWKFWFKTKMRTTSKFVSIKKFLWNKSIGYITQGNP